MREYESDFLAIYNSLTGDLAKEHRVPWVENAAVEGTVYDRAYQSFWEAREHLCQRFGLDWEDEDLERFMNGILTLEKDVARRMFDATLEYARRGSTG